RDTLKPRYCRLCKGFKPPRTHHCSDCDRCVLKMDHHCPWTNNCVGFGNQGHFLRFVYMVDVTCAMAMALHTMRMYELIVDSLNGTYYVRQPTQTEVAFLIINMTLLFFVLLLVGILSCYHLYLVARNTTTIESREKGRVAKLIRSKKCQPTPYPYDLGILRNFKSVFGDSVLLWWLPKRMAGTGLDFPIRDGLQPPVYWPPPGYSREVGGDPDRVQQRCDVTSSATIFENSGGARVVTEVDDDGEMVIRQYNSSADPALLECGGEAGEAGKFFDSGKEEKSEAGDDVDWDNDDEDYDSDDDFAGMQAPPESFASGVSVHGRSSAVGGQTITQRRSVFAAQQRGSYEGKLSDYTRDDADADIDEDNTPLMHMVHRHAAQKTR
ncbi:Palmitoyltransferase, partial [Coemansia sp. RSA 2706]